MAEVYGTIAGRQLSYESDEESAIESRTSVNLNDVALLPISKEYPNGSTTKRSLPDSRPSNSQLDQENAIMRFRDRFRGRGRRKVGVFQSLRAIVLSSSLNVLLVNIPIAWVSHFLHWHPSITFALCFLSMVPLEHLFEYGGEQLSLYCGQSLGELVAITLSNVVEATLAIILLRRCELKLLQSTIVGVILLHLLLVPGATFLTGGARVKDQILESARVQLNHTLLTVGVMALLLPAAFFAALDPPSTPTTISNFSSEANAILAASVDNQAHFLSMSRGLAIMLLIIYVSSRIFFHRPPGRENVLSGDPDAPEEIKRIERELEVAEPEVNPWVCLAFLVINVGIMAATAEWLVDSINFVMESAKITQEWFGLILLPIVSFSADGTVAIGHYVRSIYRIRFKEPIPPSTLAKSRTIDLSIQFTLFWMPFLVLLGWWTGKPMSLLFDFYEVAALIGACFLVNYVTADAKTNWAEGLILLSFYVMIGLCTWHYQGQDAVDNLLLCAV